MYKYIRLKGDFNYFCVRRLHIRDGKEKDTLTVRQRKGKYRSQQKGHAYLFMPLEVRKSGKRFIAELTGIRSPFRDSDREGHLLHLLIR